MRKINSTKRFWNEGKDNAIAKDIFRQLARKYGCGCVEEEQFTVDLHDTNDMLPKGTLRTYPVDIFITRRNPPYRIIVEIDGEYHDERRDKDTIRDKAITTKYGIAIVRFSKSDVVGGKFSEEQLVEILGL